MGYETPLRDPEQGSDEERYKTLIRQADLEGRGGNSQAATALRAAAREILRRNEVTVPKLGKYYLPRDVAFHYLSLCAGRLAVMGQRDLVTDRGQFTDVVLSSDLQLRGEVATAVIEAYLPADLLHVEVQRLAECREELSVNRLKFQAEIHGLVKTFSEVASVDTFESLKGQLVQIGQERIKQTQRTYRRAKFDVSPQALMVSLTPPALATAAESVLQSGVIGPIGLAATLALFAAGKVLDLRQARTNRDASPWSYVLDLSQRLH
ncbi:hypothetical protein JOE31_001889 [Arthrobacter sp. PvP023]|uniref:hypothetical protein n=1 Tax=Micrococcaceae TaxID=1268 RepID=UPI001AE4ABB1|nr:hypothetical protein [Arthrobacter sp. PvP023]MBP1135657.1 hypothetical protein [Arthrobacter sp. PvP023]